MQQAKQGKNTAYEHRQKNGPIQAKGNRILASGKSQMRIPAGMIDTSIELRKQSTMWKGPRTGNWSGDNESPKSPSVTNYKENSTPQRSKRSKNNSSSSLEDAKSQVKKNTNERSMPTHARSSPYQQNLFNKSKSAVEERKVSSISALSKAPQVRRSRAGLVIPKEPIPLRQKFSRRFYEPLVLLWALGQNRGDPEDEDGLDDGLETSNLSQRNLRRCFIRSLAYLCDYETGGDRATAIALESTPQGVVFWIASNRCPDNCSAGGEDRVLEFLEEVLGALVGLDRTSAELRVDQLFHKAVDFSEKRILEYMKSLRRTIPAILQDIKSFDYDDLRCWLHSLDLASKTSIGICKLCYEVRHSQKLEKLNHLEAPGEALGRHVKDLRHVIGRLSYTMKAVKVIVAAAVQLPQLFDDFQIRRQRSSRSSGPPLLGKTPTLQEIIGRMTSNEGEKAKYQEALEEMDQKFRLQDKLETKCTSTTWKPRVHAELILLDLFWRQKLDFVDRDRFIGCSKPACYCCYLYIQNHPGQFVAPQSHNNLWINWRAPDIYDPNVSSVKSREDVLGKMLITIRSAVFAQIDDRKGPAKRKADSLTEISNQKIKNERLHMESGPSNGLLSQIASGIVSDSGSDFKVNEDDMSDTGVSDDDDTSSVEADNDIEYSNGELTIVMKAGDVTIEVEETSDEEDDEADGGVLLFA